MSGIERTLHNPMGLSSCSDVIPDVLWFHESNKVLHRKEIRVSSGVVQLVYVSHCLRASCNSYGLIRRDLELLEVGFACVGIPDGCYIVGDRSVDYLLRHQYCLVLLTPCLLTFAVTVSQSI